MSVVTIDMGHLKQIGATIALGFDGFEDEYHVAVTPTDSGDKRLAAEGAGENPQAIADEAIARFAAQPMPKQTLLGD